jgi:uncharacterized membrane protein
MGSGLDETEKPFTAPRWIFLISCVVTGVAFGLSMALGARLPDSIPAHWDAVGHVTRFGPKTVPLFLMPCIMAALTILSALPFLPVKRLRDPANSLSMGCTFVIMGVVFLGVHLWTLHHLQPYALK